MKKKNKNRAFTLIELLVVIAIISIVSSIMIIALDPQKHVNNAKDAKVYANLDSVRMKASDVFSEETGFIDVASNSIILAILDTVDGEIKSDAGSWAAKAQLTNGNWYCRDSDEVVSEKATQDITDFRCD